jgi:AraC-like DNA-binding protein
LGEEETTFQKQLNQTREGLARHYLVNSDISSAEISFLVGFDDPSSFIRAFNLWTGITPERFRKENKIV